MAHCQRSATWIASGAPSVAPGEQAQALSRQTTCTPGMLTQPPGEGAGLPVVQHVDGLAGPHVDQQGRIRMPAAPFRKIIHASTVTWPIPGSASARISWISVSQQTPTPSSASNREAPPGQGQRHQLQQPAQQHRAAGTPLGEPRDRLSERPHPARLILAGQTADRERDQDRAPRCGQIMQKPAVVAVDPGGGRAASPARCRSARRMRATST